MIHMLLRCLVLAALATSGVAARADYPARTIRLIVPFAAGGSTDLVARLLADKMAPLLGQPVVVENRGGAGGSVGADAVAHAAPDGYTLGMATVSTHGANPAIHERLPYDPIRDFTPITNIVSVPSVFVVHPSVPAQTMTEFIALVRARPGKYTFASPGVGSLGHVNIELFMELAGIEMLHVPYKGAAQAANDAVAGIVDAMTDNLPSSLPHVQAGRLRPLAVLAPRRSPLLPDVPTYRELGFAEMSEGGWFGLVAPAGLPPALQKRLHRAAHQAMQTREFKARVASLSGTVMANEPEQFAAEIRAALEKYRRIAAKAGLRPEP